MLPLPILKPGNQTMFFKSEPTTPDWRLRLSNGEYAKPGGIPAHAVPSLNRSQNHPQMTKSRAKTMSERYRWCREAVIADGIDFQHRTVR